MSRFTERTEKALGQDLMSKLRENRFCVIGCSGTGSNFAEMLVRTGATKLDLIDGSSVERSGLNRVFAFAESDCEEKKTTALKNRLEAIRPGELCIHEFRTHFRAPEESLGNIEGEGAMWSAVSRAYAVFIAVDDLKSRISIERFCNEHGEGRYLSCGILVDPKKDGFQFECIWKPDSSNAEIDIEEGYGPDNASFASIVVEATSVAFTMLLSHMKDPDSYFIEYSKHYNSAFLPVEAGS